MLHLVIMAGGGGTRFWPASRRDRPKQFLALAGPRTLLQQAADRCRPWIPPEQMHVVTQAAHVPLVREQLPDVPASNILAEPCGRNTAPCIGLAALAVRRLDPDALMLVVPADHWIRPEAEFHATVERGVALLERHPEASVLLGIVPTRPATGYGYIQRGPAVAGNDASAVRVLSFREKPAREIAEGFVASGDYYWNAGIFLWRATGILNRLQDHQPALYDRLLQLDSTLGTEAAPRALAAIFPGMPSISIDHAVLEPLAARGNDRAAVFVVPAAFEWDDVGSWRALPGLLGADAAGNTVVGPHCGVGTTGCIVSTTPGHLVATIGCENLVVVHTPDSTLIAPRDDEEALRRLAALLIERGLERFL